MMDLQPNMVSRSLNEAVAIRQTFNNYFNGVVPWQVEAIRKFKFQAHTFVNMFKCLAHHKQ